MEGDYYFGLKAQVLTSDCLELIINVLFGLSRQLVYFSVITLDFNRNLKETLLLVWTVLI